MESKTGKDILAQNFSELSADDKKKFLEEVKKLPPPKSEEQDFSIKDMACQILEDLNTQDLLDAQAETDKKISELIATISTIKDKLSLGEITKEAANSATIIPQKEIVKLKEQMAQKRAKHLPYWNIRTIRDTKEMWVYNKSKGRWQPHADQFIQTWVANNIDRAVSSKYNDIIKTIQGMTWIDREVFKEPYGYINVKNGVVEIRNKKLLQHHPSYNFKYIVEVDWNPLEDCPVYKKCLSEAISPEAILILQEWYGYLFAPGQKYKVALFVAGQPDTGKSKLVGDIINLLLNNGEFVSNQSFAAINADTQYALARVYEKQKANVHADLGQQKIKDASNFKQLTGGDKLSARQIYKPSFEFVADSKLCFLCNKLPPLSAEVDDDEAFWNRIIVIEFPKKPTAVDRELDKKLQAEIVGILNFAIDGFQRLEKQNGFTQSSETAYNHWHDYMKRDNPISDFITQYFRMPKYDDSEKDKKYDIWVAKDRVRTLYLKWCFENTERPLTDTAFGLWMKRIGLTTSQHRDDEGDRYYAWSGIEEIDIEIISDAKAIVNLMELVIK